MAIASTTQMVNSGTTNVYGQYHDFGASPLRDVESIFITCRGASVNGALILTNTNPVGLDHADYRAGLIPGDSIEVEPNSGRVEVKWKPRDTNNPSWRYLVWVQTSINPTVSINISHSQDPPRNGGAPIVMTDL